MGIVDIFPEKIRLEDLNLGFQLTAERSGYPVDSEKDAISYGGSEIITFEEYRDGKAFGITNIEVDTSLNLQPQVEITFKDLYGNLVFRTGGNTYSKIFELPPAKFTLTIKGYLGKPVSYILQLRSTSINYVASDGSFEIKAKFVPNIYGFFGDIPYKFLYAVDKLKEGRGGTPSQNSILNISKNGSIVSEKVETAAKQFDDIKKKIESLLTGGNDLYEIFRAGGLSSDGKVAGDIATINAPTDLASVTDPPFTNIIFNINYKNEKNLSVTSNDENTKISIGDAIKLSIQTEKDKTRIDFFKSGWGNDVKKLQEQKKLEDVNKILSDNLRAIERATQQTAGRQIEKEVIDSQTIGSVMGALAGGAAYILGFIIEGALLGETPERADNKDIIGRFYPLAYKENTTDGTGGQTMYDQVPYDGATKERDYVQKFMKAQYEGTQQVQKFKEEQQAKENGTDGAMDAGAMIRKRLTNAEAFLSNPYGANCGAGDFITKLMQRSGIINTRFAGPLVKDGDATSGRDDSLVSSEIENIKNRLYTFVEPEKSTLRKFATRITEFYDSNGAVKSGKKYSDIIPGETSSYQTYFQDYVQKMQNSLPKEMFLNNGPESLGCKYFVCNNVMYNNESDLQDAIGNGKDVYIYIPSDKAQLPNSTTPETGQNAEADPGNSTGATQSDITETLNGGSADKSAPYANTEFFGFKKVSDIPGGIGEPSNPTLAIDYNKLMSQSYTKASDMVIKLAKTAGQGITVPEEGAYVAPLFFAGATKKNYVFSMRTEEMMKTLVQFCNVILKETAVSDADRQKKQAEEEKKQNPDNSQNGTSVDQEAYEPYSFDATVYNAIYHQFHHIANAWLTIARTSLNTEPKGIAESKQLPEKMEEAYVSTTASPDRPYNMTFSYAMQSSTVNNDKLKNAIVNTSSLLETDTESTVFSVMSNIAQQNNFLLQSIPGGLKGGNSDFDVQELFLPQVFDKGLGNSSLCFIWQPTPESRAFDNRNNFLYQDESNLRQAINNLAGSIPVFKFGSPTNVIVKTIKASTDDNKVTGESIAAVDDIINPSNQSKKRAFDCSMLSVMQGRSYKISLDILGNANFIPTQRFAIDNLPIFNGLYWTSNVKHNITPNEMTTSIEAIKLKYDGNQKFIQVPPVTTDNYKGTTQNFSESNDGTTTNNGGGQESIVSDGLNWDFLQLVKNEKLKNSSDINKFIEKYTKAEYKTYPEWFNSTISSKYSICKSKIVADKWAGVWDRMIPVVYPDYGNPTAGINFLEFLALNTIMYNETGGKYKPSPEGVNSVNNARPGILYAYESFALKNYTKAGYNKKSNKTAGQLFKDAGFKSQFKGLPFGNDKRVAGSTDARWDSVEFPKDLFPNDLKEAAASSTPTFINEADFFKFRGRGYIQTTWRDGYRKLVSFVIGYQGADNLIKKYKGIWTASPYNGNLETILDRSSNSDWDSLFDNAPEISAIAIINHAKGGKNYQYFKDLSKPKEDLQKALSTMASRISGDWGGGYPGVFCSRIYAQLDELAVKNGLQKATVNNSNQPTQVADKPLAVTASQKDIMNKTLGALFATTGGAGEKGLCGVYTVSAAKNYADLLKDPTKSVPKGPFNRNRGNAKDKSLRDTLESYGYKVFFIGKNLTKKDITEKISQQQWGIGDVTIYWADDTENGSGGHTKYGHIQIYGGKSYNNANWATSVPTNYGSPDLGFVYGRQNNNSWQLYVCRAPIKT